MSDIVTNVTLYHNTTTRSSVKFENNYDRWAVEFVSTVYLYYIPTLVGVGIFGNVLSIYVFHNSKLRFQSTSKYLTALAVSDTVFLIQLLPTWLNAAKITNIFNGIGFCQIYEYLSYITCCTSAWFVVAFTVERFVAVLYPLRRNALCTPTRSLYIISYIVIISILVNAPVIWFVTHNNDCNIDHRYLNDAERFNAVDTVLSFTLPLAIITILNWWIVVGVCRLDRARRQLLKTESQGTGRRERFTGSNICPRSQQKVTRMLLTVSTVYVILNLPAYTIRVIAYVDKSEVPGRWVALQRLLMMLFNANFGINFFLYCLSGQNFRQEFIRCISCRRQNRRQPRLVRRGTPRVPRTHTISNDSIATYHHSSSCETGSNFNASILALTSPNQDIELLPSFQGTPRHEIMELVELPARERPEYEPPYLRSERVSGYMGTMNIT